jgi:hypothetical protein
MTRRSSSGTDLPAGILLALFGAAGIWGALDMRRGTAISMGPGYFPLLVFSAIVVLGLVVAFRGWRGAGAPVAVPLWRPILCITASLLSFWLLIEHAGFVVAGMVSLMISIKAQSHLRWRRALVFSAITVAVTGLVFVVGLSLPFPLWPSFS